MAFIIHSDERVEFGYLPQAAWDTPAADNGLYRELKFPKGVFVNENVQRSDLDLNRSSRIQNLADVYTDALSGPVMLTAPEMLVSRARFADFIFAVTQNRVSQGAGPGFTKQYKLHASQPDFTANEGYFFTLAQKPVLTAKHLKVRDCVVKSLTIDIDKSGVGDALLVRFRDVQILGRRAEVVDFTGAWVATDTNRYNASSFTIEDNDATAIDWMRFSLSIDNGAEPLDKDANGYPKTFFLNPPKMGVARATIGLWYNAATLGVQDYEALYRAGTARLFSIERGTAGNLDHIKISLRGIIQDTPKGAEGRRLTMPLNLVVGNDGANDGLVIDFTDEISQ